MTSSKLELARKVVQGFEASLQARDPDRALELIAEDAILENLPESGEVFANPQLALDKHDYRRFCEQVLEDGRWQGHHEILSMRENAGLVFISGILHRQYLRQSRGQTRNSTHLFSMVLREQEQGMRIWKVYFTPDQPFDR